MTSPFPEGPLWALFLVAVLGSAVAGYGAVLIAQHPHEAWRLVRARFTVGTQFGLGLTVALLIVSGLFWAFTEVVESWTRQTDLYAFDAAAHDLAVSFTSPSMTTLMKGVTMLGNAWVAALLTAALAGVLALRHKVWAVLALGLVMGPGEGLVYALKAFFERVRPIDPLIHIGGYSFPSGHSFTAAALYGFGVYLLWSRRLGTRHLPVLLRVGLTTALVALILAVGTSRVYLGAHYVTDVIGGFILAAGWLVAVVTLVRLFRHPSSPPEPS